MDTVRVLVWGTAETGACAYYRGHLYDEPLRELGVEMRHVNRLPQDGKLYDRHGHEVDLTGMTPDDVSRGMNDGSLELYTEVDTADLDWADIVLFRRYYNTHYACRLPSGYCDFRTFSRDAALAHPHGIALQPGGQPKRDTITEIVWSNLLASREKAIVYDTDDLLINHGVKTWNGIYPDAWAQETRVREMARHADLVTVSTPTLARHYGPLNRNIRVIRNSVDTSLYVADEAAPEGKPRVLYYGSAVRLRDYSGYPDERGKVRGGYAYLAVEENRRDLHRIFVGCEPSMRRKMTQIFDEVHGYVEGIPAFARFLANLHPDIGIAPLMGDEADACKSELHWLEYSLAGAATVATRIQGGPDAGPYNVIRDGTDGLLCRGRQDWSDAMRRLVRNPSLRADLAGAARERVIREYDHRDRAREWAEAFRWAAEHQGIGKVAA